MIITRKVDMYMAYVNFIIMLVEKHEMVLMPRSWPLTITRATTKCKTNARRMMIVKG